jgi:spermidine synthase
MSPKKKSNIIKIKSDISNNFIYVKNKHNGTSQMWFTDSIEHMEPTSYQTIYNKYNLDKFYLTYFYPLFTCFNYINGAHIKKCLCIGLGGGHIPLFLQKKYPNLHIDVVEIDGGVYTASKYMGFSESNTIKVYIEDGINYIAKVKYIYNIIIIDLDGEESFNGFDFKNVSNILQENGILVINSYFTNKNDGLKKRLSHVFKCIKHYELDHNDVFLCRKNLNEFQKMIQPITNITLSPIFDKYRYEFIDIMNSYKSKIILS